MSGRVVKDPAVRKQEILDTAMVLFYQKGYDATSIADIAKAMHVVPGLCYRYFTSKKEMFDEAVKQYAVESSQPFLGVIRDRSNSFRARLDLFGDVMKKTEDNSRYHDFYHAPGNETFHLQLGLEMFKYLAPHISRELAHLNDIGEVNVEDPDLMTEFLLYGQVALWLSLAHEPDPQNFNEKMQKLKGYMFKLLDM